MIAIDSSSMIAFLAGDRGADVEAVADALQHASAALPAPVLAELLSDPSLSKEVVQLFIELPLLEVTGGFWRRAGHLRASVLRNGHRAPLADTLIAQNCVDHALPLVTRDRDFRHFVEAAELVLVP